MGSSNAFQEAWKNIETRQPLPRRIRRQVEIPFEEFKKEVLQQNPDFVAKTVEELYAGDVYLLKGTFPAEFMRNIRKTLHELGKKTPSEFHKMLEGCPNYHRIIDKDAAKNYSFESIKHSYYFFPWNSDPFNIFEETYKRWRIVKFLSGLAPDEYERNTPKDGIVDRIQVVHYPAGAGRIETHSDPYKHQRLIISCFMTKRGIDYKTGGVYFIDKNGNKVDMEDGLSVGDMQLYYPTILHGVQTIDEEKEVDWGSINGRWWFGPFSNATDHQQERHTGFGVRDVNAVPTR